MTVINDGTKFVITEVRDEETVELLHIELGDNVKITAYDTDVNLESIGGNITLKSESDVTIESETGETNIKCHNSVNLFGRNEGDTAYVQRAKFDKDGSGYLATENIRFSKDGYLMSKTAQGTADPTTEDIPDGYNMVWATEYPDGSKVVRWWANQGGILGCKTLDFSGGTGAITESISGTTTGGDHPPRKPGSGA